MPLAHPARLMISCTTDVTVTLYSVSAVTLLSVQVVSAVVRGRSPLLRSSVAEKATALSDACPLTQYLIVLPVE